MGILSFLNRDNNQDFFGPLRWAVLSLQNKRKDTHLTIKNSYTQTTDQYITDDDPELPASIIYRKKTTPVPKTILTTTPLYKIKKLKEIQPLLNPLMNFYSYLYNAKHSISNGCVYDIGEEAYTLVKEMDAYLNDPNETTLKQVEKAKDNFQNTCKCIKTRSKIFSALVGAVLAAAVVIIYPPAVVPFAAKIVLTTGAAMVGALGATGLLEKSQSPISEYAPINEAINSLLPDNKSKPSTSSNKINPSKIDFEERLRMDHNEMVGDGDEKKDTGSRLSPFSCCRR